MIESSCINATFGIKLNLGELALFKLLTVQKDFTIFT